MTVHVYNILGGLVGIDGWVSSMGTWAMANELGWIPGVTEYSFQWDKTDDIIKSLCTRHLIPNEKTIIIGYSGGGSRATWVAEHVAFDIDLMILLDPSPKWQMHPIAKNVKRVLLFHNNMPEMGDLGGGDVTLATGNDITRVDRVEIGEQHLLVQMDSIIRNRIVAEIEDLAR